jgi:hypothetical protein
MYMKDMKHPSARKCHCGKFLHIKANTSCTLAPIAYFYEDTCVYHTDSISEIIFSRDGKNYKYKVSTRLIYPDTLYKKPCQNHSFLNLKINLKINL